MAKFIVKMHITNTKDINVYASDEDEAKEKAEKLVSGWDNVVECEAIDAEEE